MSVIAQRYVPEIPKFATEKGELKFPTWMATACSMAETSQHSEMLSDSLLAMSLSLIALERPDENFSVASLKQYTSALRGLRSTLESGISGLSQHQIDISLITCLACGMYEVESVALLTSLLLT